MPRPRPGTRTRPKLSVEQPCFSWTLMGGSQGSTLVVQDILGPTTRALMHVRWRGSREGQLSRQPDSASSTFLLHEPDQVAVGVAHKARPQFVVRHLGG